MPLSGAVLWCQLGTNAGKAAEEVQPVPVLHGMHRVFFQVEVCCLSGTLLEKSFLELSVNVFGKTLGFEPSVTYSH